MDLDAEKHGKRARCELAMAEGPATSFLEKLPREIILDILSRLPVTSLAQFRCVGRACRMAAQDSLLAKLHLSRRAQSDPCLILHSDYPIRNQLSFVDTCAENKDKDMVRKLSIPFMASMPEFEVVGSCNGLLCLVDSLYNDAVYVHNPLTRDFKQLPKCIHYPGQKLVYGFGFHPMTEVYMVVRVGYYGTGISPQSEVQVLNLGSPTWRSLGKAPYQLDRRRPSEALVNGRLHWLTKRRRLVGQSIVSFHLADEQFTEVPKPQCGGLRRCNQLVAIGGCLSAAVHHHSNEELEIWVMKEYGVEASWIKEFNIGIHLPKGLKHGVGRPDRIWRNAQKVGGVRVLCLLKNGEILMEHRSRGLVSYDPEGEELKFLTLKGLPKWFQTFVHVGSLNWIDTNEANMRNREHLL